MMEIDNLYKMIELIQISEMADVIQQVLFDLARVKIYF